MFAMLLWKEWVEQRWRMAFGTVVVGSLTMMGLYARMMPDENVLTFACMIGAFLAMLVGMGVVAPERESGTLRTLLLLPVRPWWVLLAKALIAIPVCLVPLSISLTIALLMAGEREVAMSRIVTLYGAATLLALTLLIWTVSLSIRASSESYAGMIAVGIIAVSTLLQALCVALNIRERSYWPWNPLAFVGSLTDRVEGGQRFALDLLSIQGGLAALLILFALWQFARFGRRSR